MPLAIFIVALLAAGITIAVNRAGDETPRARVSPRPSYTFTNSTPSGGTTTTTPPATSTTTSPTASGTTEPSPTDTGTSASPSPTDTSGTTSPTSIPPTSTSILPTSTVGPMPRTGGPVGSWLFGGLALMLLSTALMRAVTRRPA
jgi:hypothetical protein